MTTRTKTTFKNLGYTLMVIAIFAVINAASMVFLVFQFIDRETIILSGNKEIIVNYLDALKNWQVGLIYLFMGLGFIISIFYTKFLYKEIIRKLDRKKQNLVLDKELEIKKEALKIEKEKQEMDILRLKAEAGLLSDKEIKKLEDKLC